MLQHHPFQFLLMANRMAVSNPLEGSVKVTLFHHICFFFLCTEGFTSILAKAELEGMIHGVSVCRRAPKISNLLFADNSLLFYWATQMEVQVVTEILQTYAKASGQSINLEKSSVYFSRNTPHN